jgi:hypothetical protein
MTTQKQIEANQQNALFSTGAKTAEGKAVVSKNAIRHGVFSKDLITSDGKESVAEYQELLNNLITSLAPSDQMEYLLVEKIAVDFWRLKRLLRFESGSIFKRIIGDVSSLFDQTIDAETVIRINSLPDQADVEKIMRYESALQKSILQNLAMLKKLQELRLGLFCKND